MSNTSVNEDRLRRTGSEEREDRAMTDRPITENRVLSDDERIEMFRKQHHQNVLPDLPKIPGHHVVWLSTTNQADNIAHRMRLGYEPVTRADVAGWNYDQMSLKTGEYAGLIGINEMVAYKISDKLYQAFMREAHHNAPNQQSEKLVQDVDMIKSQAKSGKSYVAQYDGQDSIEHELRTPNPTFE